MMEGRRILLVGGWPEAHTALRTTLEGQGYVVTNATDGAAAQAVLRSALPDLVVLDTVTLDADGLPALRAIRAGSAAPVLMLGSLSGEDATIRALQLGADDYLTHPVSPRELLARIESALRRAALPAAVPPAALVVDADLAIDFARNRVIVRGKDVALTAHEYRLLHHLVSNAGRLMPYDVLLARVWGPEYQGDVHYVRLYVSYLRAKIEPDARHPKYILTEKGLGYRFTALGPHAQDTATRRPDG